MVLCRPYLEYCQMSQSGWQYFLRRASARLGTVILVAMLFSIAGLVFGILSRMEKDKFYFFPDLGILLNGIGVCATGFILYAGVFGL